MEGMFLILKHRDLVGGRSFVSSKPTKMLLIDWPMGL